MRKPHPCGANHWLIRRSGADFRLECAGCGHQIWLSRTQLERRLRRFLARGPRAQAVESQAPQPSESGPEQTLDSELGGPEPEAT